ncbi:FkbM family methyltransferase [Acidisoma sp.]|uniref:FkbM family methyltransferase n=1 Tax=Acidisoma sp. TaxID=1872115 RepID=UPI003B00F2D7
MRLPWARTRPIPEIREPWTTTFEDTASEADILGCFRLILGRMPNPEEWRGHSSRVGEPLGQVVSSYVTSLEFQRRGFLNRDPGEDIVSTEVQGFRIYSNQNDAAVGKPVRDDNYEPDVTRLFRSRLQPGMSVVDIGANIGYFTMLAATLVGAQGHVLAVEPNPRNVRLLEASRRANGFDNVTVAQSAAGRETGILILNTSFSNGTTSAPPDELGQLLAAESVSCLRLDSLLDAWTTVDLIKVDVEGAEYNALLGAEATIRRCRPFIISEFSPGMIPGISHISGEDYLSWLISLGYVLGVVEPDGSLSETGTDIDAVMRIYRSRMSDHIDIAAQPR